MGEKRKKTTTSEGAEPKPKKDKKTVKGSVAEDTNGAAPVNKKKKVKDTKETANGSAEQPRPADMVAATAVASTSEPATAVKSAKKKKKKSQQQGSLPDAPAPAILGDTVVEDGQATETERVNGGSTAQKKKHKKAKKGMGDVSVETPADASVAAKGTTAVAQEQRKQPESAENVTAAPEAAVREEPAATGAERLKKKSKKQKKELAGEAGSAAQVVEPPSTANMQEDKTKAKKEKKKKKRTAADAELDGPTEVEATAAVKDAEDDGHKPPTATASVADGVDTEDANGKGTPAAVTEMASPTDGAKSSGGPKSGGGTGGRAFQRVKAEEWLGKQGAWDNSYEKTFGNSGWGAKAQQILGQVRGKDFRHEKTKKKRGSYRGGLIETNAVNSFKFADSDDE